MDEDTARGDRKGRRGKSGLGAIVRRGLDGARQMMHPAPFRIKQSLDLVTIVAGVMPAPKHGTAVSRPRKELDADSRHLLHVIASVATAVWRMKTKLEAESKAELPAELRHLPRHVQAAWDALTSGEIEIRDHKGDRYDPGMAVHPVTYSPDSSVPPNTIVETLKPTVFWKDVLIQRADVILASPADEPGLQAQQQEETSK